MNRDLIGVDIGGTFTDLVGYRNGEIVLAKTLTTPANPALGVATALELSNTRLTELQEFLHGSTIAINTVLERKGARTALLTTRGFRDVYEIGRGNRPEAFDLEFQRPRPLVPRELRLEVDERLNARGEILVPIDPQQIEAFGRQLGAHGVESVAICFLHAYANPIHEQAAGALLRERFPQLFVTLSHEILREYREYERSSTTVLNAYVGPRVKQYLRHLQADLRTRGFAGSMHIMRSNGGSMSLAHACEEPVSMMESGPVAGMIGAGEVARLLGIEQAIGFDMGGTTAKATLIIDGVPAIEEGYYIGGYASGQPMQLPVVAIVEVGAGGGSIAWRDAAGQVHVGPQSAGADPGPVCYGRGGAAAPVTDANLLLGRLNANRFLGGGMTLNAAAAARALDTTIAQPAGLGTTEAALGVVTIADTAMALAVRAVSVRKGIDPRDTTMIAFGGAGPLHAAALCKEIHRPRLVIPKMPGNFSALGMLLAPWRQDFVRTLIGVLGRLDPAWVDAAFGELRSQAEQHLHADRLAIDAARLDYAADLRYRGQEHSIPVPLDGPGNLCRAIQQVRDAFDALHERRYGHANSGEVIEVVNLRLTVSLPRAAESAYQFLGTPVTREPLRSTTIADDQAQFRNVVFTDAECPVPARVLWRPELQPGELIAGPAIIEEPNSTTLLFPGDQARISMHGHIEITIHLPEGVSQ